MSDIVEELRDNAFACHLGNLTCEAKLLHAAADAIMQLRQQVTDLHGSAVDEGMCATPVETALWNALRIARSERDEARKTACEWGSKNVRGAKLIAQIQGWDCFKEQP